MTTKEEQRIILIAVDFAASQLLQGASFQAIGKELVGRGMSVDLTQGLLAVVGFVLAQLRQGVSAREVQKRLFERGARGDLVEAIIDQLLLPKYRQEKVVPPVAKTPPSPPKSGRKRTKP
ncbi:MAG: hypothetical protein HQL87_02675 [Magnetococcales bacterium]|nr:hypothetical protein [Magnetococcales bacterium]